jgi:hypothetical protein
MARNRNGVRVTLYMPDELRRQAREAGVNLSRTLRAAVEQELRRDAPEPEHITGARLSAQKAPGGVELTLFVPIAVWRRLKP